MNTPIISVIVPVYNSEKTLGECLDSILGQKNVDLEIIAVDDGSTDSSLSILESYANDHENVSFIRNPNKFAGTARNAGIEASKGEFLAFLDSDDVLTDGALPFLLELIKKKKADFWVVQLDRRSML